MSDKTRIEWTDATWNPVTGCTKVSAGCKNCYAEREWPRMAKLVPAYAGREFNDVRTHGERLDQPLPLLWKKPRKVFVNSMSDLFHPDVSNQFIASVFRVMRDAPQHVFQVLTKRAERMRDFCTVYYPFPLPNVWLGVSVEDQSAANERIPLLLDTPAAVRWISAEPLLGPVDLVVPFAGAKVNSARGARPGIPPLDWVVVGGESGPNARPMHPQWARGLRDQCAAAGVPFLFKQWGEWAPRSGPLTGGGTDFVALDPGCKRWPHVTRMGEHGMDTRACEHCTPDAGEDIYMQRVGKKLAGRLLDGITHDGYPI